MDARKERIHEDRQRTLDPHFWEDAKEAERIQRRIGAEEFWVLRYEAAEREVEDWAVMLEFAAAGEPIGEEELAAQAAKAQQAVEELQLSSTLNDEADPLSCILKINAGAGGTESCDWANMLMRMYTMWAQRRGFALRELHRVDGEVAGIKSVSLEISGEYVYGWLKGENGVHRLVRPSPFNANNKRQTTFASVFVFPLVDDSIHIEINPADLSWDTFRSSGAGGQHVNTTDSAVRVRHTPSGIIVECQQERSQHQNRDKALQMLKSELYQQEVQRREATKSALEAQKAKIEWGSQIRSYVLDDRRVKDHRSQHTSHDPKRVLDGDIDDFLKATLMV